MTYRQAATAAMLCFSVAVLVACGGGGGEGAGGGGSDAGTAKGPIAAVFADDSTTFTPGEAVGVTLENVVPGELSVVVDGSPTSTAQPDDEEAVIVLPELAAGSHTLTLTAHGSTVTLRFDVSELPLSGDARQHLLDLIDDALAQLDAYLASNPADAAAAGLRDRLAAAAASIATATQEQLAALHRQFSANGLPKADVPGSCNAAPAQYKVRLRKMLNTARLASWLATRHADSRSSASEVAALLAQARMEQAWRSLLAYAEAATQMCGQDVLAGDTARGRKWRQRAAAAAAGV